MATPCYGGLVHQLYMQSVLRLLQMSPAMGFRLSIELLGCDSLITRSRNTLVAKFLNTPGATHLLFVDADIAFEPEQIARMLRFRQDVVAAMYPLKMILWDSIAMARLEAGEGPETAAMRYVGYPAEGKEFETRDGFVTAHYVGAGCLLIARHAMERLIEAYPETAYRVSHTGPGANTSPNQYALFDCMIDPDNGHYLSEDYAFCRRWRQIGGKVWLDTTAKLIHIGMHEFAGDPTRRPAAK